MIDKADYLMTPNAVVLPPETLEVVPLGGEHSQEPVFARALQMVHDGLATLNANEGDIGELLSQSAQTILTPVALGQVLMAVLPFPEPGHGSRLSLEQKIYWGQVAAHMGPDWIAELRRVAAFMDKVEQF